MVEHLNECQYAKDDVNSGHEMFQMEVVSSDTDPLRRILREAIRIKDVIEGEEMVIKEKDPEDMLDQEIRAKLRILNSKREFHLPTLGAAQVNNVSNML